MASKLQMIALQSQYDWVLMQIMQSLSQHPAKAVAMQMAIIVLTPNSFGGLHRRQLSALHPLQEGIFGREEKALGV